MKEIELDRPNFLSGLNQLGSLLSKVSLKCLGNYLMHYFANSVDLKTETGKLVSTRMKL